MKLRHALLVCLLSMPWVGACGRPTPKQVVPPVPKVTVAKPVVREVRAYEDFLGRTNAIDNVDMRARVTGYLNKVCFKDGAIVKAGDLLYEIDPRPFVDEVERIRGEIESLKANKKLLDIQVDRYTKLARDKAASQQDLDEYLAKQASNVGSIRSAEAQLKKAELNLTFTKVIAPITGKIGRTLLTAGNIVNADATLLCTIVSIDPIYVYFSVEEPAMLEIRRMTHEGKLKTLDHKSVEVRMGLSDDTEKKFPLRGVVDFVNNTVDSETGTIVLRGVFDNHFDAAHPALMEPGMSTRMRLASPVVVKACLIDERAVGTDQGEKYVYVVDEKNVVVYRRIKLGQKFDGLLAVESGLKPDDRVVIAGLQRVRPKITVEPEEVDMAKAVADRLANPK
jgi:RND family efflux transporter MFP subunit